MLDASTDTAVHLDPENMSKTHQSGTVRMALLCV
jgi:hypothetical protein